MSTIGIDIGGTKVRAILWDGKRVACVREYQTPKTRKDFEKTIVEVVRLLSEGRNLRSIGIGAAGIMERTIWIASPNIPHIKNLDFRTLWPHSVKVKLDNDARCFARAEFLRGAGRGFQSIFALTIGTGVGRAYGQGGRIFILKNFEYPEAWEKRYQSLRDTEDYRRLAAYLGRKFSTLITPFQPEVVVLGGGVMRERGFFRLLRQAFRTNGLEAKIRRASLGTSAGALGAALLSDR